MSRISLWYAGFIYSRDSWDKFVDLDIMHRVIDTHSYYEWYRQYHGRLFSISFFDFFGICRCETNIGALLPDHTKYL